MTSGGAWNGPLDASHLRFLQDQRRGVLATTADDGHARLVPICFAVVLPGSGSAAPGAEPRLYTPIDVKPKVSADPLRLARVRDIAVRPTVTVLVDRWDEAWDRLAWVRLVGRATVIDRAGGDGEHEVAIAALRARYLQYAAHPLEERPLIRVDVSAVTAWGDLS